MDGLSYNSGLLSACRDTTAMPVLRLADGRRVPYQIRVSQRSRRVRLTLNRRDGLVMVAPPGVSRWQLARLAHEWRDWVARHLDAMEHEDPGIAADRIVLPDTLELIGIEEEWPIRYRDTPSASARVTERDSGELLLSGASDDVLARVAALRRWLMRRARDTLPELLDEVSEETGLEFADVTIRAQRGRWGSCSTRGNISLNFQLLFLPPPLVRHVLLHELCHTVEMNHSPRFWSTVRRFEPDLEEMRAEMRRARTHVPEWLAAGV